MEQKNTTKLVCNKGANSVLQKDFPPSIQPKKWKRQLIIPYTHADIGKPLSASQFGEYHCTEADYNLHWISLHWNLNRICQTCPSSLTQFIEHLGTIHISKNQHLTDLQSIIVFAKNREH